MLKKINTCLLILFLQVSIKGFCTDSAYVYIGWYGDVDKPYPGFLFYKEGGIQPAQIPGFIEGNYFDLQIKLPGNTFGHLMDTLSGQFNKAEPVGFPGNTVIAYSITSVNNTGISYTRYINNKEDLVKVYYIIKKLLNGTLYCEEVEIHWQSVFRRLGIQKTG